MNFTNTSVEIYFVRQSVLGAFIEKVFELAVFNNIKIPCDNMADLRIKTGDLWHSHKEGMVSLGVSFLVTQL